MDADVLRELEAGSMVLGGCVIDEGAPDHRCRTCGVGIRRGKAVSTATRVNKANLRVALNPGHGGVRHVIGRLVLTGMAASKKPRPSAELLLDIVAGQLLEDNVRVRYLITPAGFIRFKLQAGQGRSVGWRTDPALFESLLSVAKHEVNRQLGGPLIERLARVADYLVIGADGSVANLARRPYGETAVVLRLADGQVVAATGKSYPNTQQAGRIVLNRAVANHTASIDGELVSVLICHDLVSFGKRSARNRRSAARVGAAQRLQEAVADDADVYLHLPHTMDTLKNWKAGWKGLLSRRGPSAVVWASAIKYRTSSDRCPGRTMPKRLMAGTSSGHGDVLDIIVEDTELPD